MTSKSINLDIDIFSLCKPSKLDTTYILSNGGKHIVKIQYILDDVIRSKQEKQKYGIYCISNNSNCYVKVDIIKSDKIHLKDSISRTPNPSLELVENYYNEIPPYKNINVSIPIIDESRVLITFSDACSEDANTYVWSLTDKSWIRDTIVGSRRSRFIFQDLRSFESPVSQRPSYIKGNYNFSKLNLNQLGQMEIAKFCSIMDDNLDSHVPHVSKLIGDYLM